MARNSEKAQSMLYRFREQQAIDSGMGDRQKGDRRPRMASSVTNLRDCERWRGDILRDISRKVSKIQDGESASGRARGEAVASRSSSSVCAFVRASSECCVVGRGRGRGRRSLIPGRAHFERVCASTTRTNRCVDRSDVRDGLRPAARHLVVRPRPS